jgi:hypothetical protein
MMTRTMLSSLTAVALALGAFVAVAQELPTLDVAPLCRAQAKAAQDLGDACLADEKRAREELVRQWAQFSPDSRARCTGIAKSIAGAQSYVELITCLQMAKDVKGLPKE